MFTCHECGNAFTKKQKDVKIDKEGYGDFYVKGVIHYYCENCGSSRIPSEEIKRIEIENVSFSILQILNEHKVVTLLELKNTLKCEMKVLMFSLDTLSKQEKIVLDKDKEITEVYLNKNENNKILSFLKKIFRRN